MKASKVAQKIENVAPLNIAESWDNPGFQIGSKSKEVKKVLTTLDITPDTINEAIENDIDMIISHHPFFFRSFKNIDLNTTKGKMIKDVINNDIVIYTAHTNLDKSAVGINYYIGNLLGLSHLKPLVPDNKNFGFYKLVIYVPDEYEESIRSVFKHLNLGYIGGNYKDTTFRTAGVGTFRPLENANPFIGETSILEEVEETKVETIVPKNLVSKAINEIKKAHPYEEMAYDLFPVEIRETQTTEGLGVIGSYDKAISTEEFIKTLKKIFEQDKLRQAGPKPKKVKKVAICTGSGSEFIRKAKSKKADVFITGDLKYHDGQLAQEEKIWVIDIGHYGTEKFTKHLLKVLLDNLEDIEVIETEEDKDFITTI